MTFNDWPHLRLEPEKVTIMFKTGMRKTGTASTIVLAALLASGCVGISHVAHGQTVAAKQETAIPPESAEHFLSKLYERYRPNGPALRDSVQRPDLLPRVYDESLLKLMQANKAYATGELLDYDLICDCQDYGVSDLKVITAKEEKGHVSATAIFKNYNDSKQVSYDLIRSGNILKIYNIRTKTVDLRAVLSIK